MSPSKSYLAENRFGGPWSREKLDCVQSYIKSYLQVMKKQNWADLWYIDAFSGNGLQRMKAIDGTPAPERLFSSDDYSEEVKGFITGSSLRAIEASMESHEAGCASFQHYIFIELNENKLNDLRKRIEANYPEEIPKCKFIPQDVNEALPEVLENINWKYERGVCFIDPFATQLQWSSMESFRRTKADVWLLSPLSAIIRQLPCNRMPGEAICDRLDHIFGDEGWRGLYHEPEIQQPTLFEIEEPSEQQFVREHGDEELTAYITQRLESVFPGVFGPAILKTGNNAPFFLLYGLVANGSSKAIGAAGRIMRSLINSLDRN